MSRRDTLSRIIDRLGRFERPGRPTSVRRPSRAVWVAVTATAIAVPLAAAVEPRTIEFEAAPTPVSPVANGGVPVLPWLTVAQQGVTFPAGFTLGGVGDGTIPPTMLAAYRQAESALAQSSPSCNLPWWLLAGIGHVESGHAAGGNVDESGRTLGDIYGVVLDGTTPDTAVVLDTDGGEIDGDDTYDRAVGPMQFLPSTWQLFGTDGNDDGIVDPHNIYDATRSAGEYLCSFGGDLSTGEAMRAAVLGYNPSDQYVQDVIAAGEAYRDGRTPPPLWTPPTVPPGSPPPPVIVADGPVDAYDTDWWNDGWDEAAWDDALWDDDHGAQAVAPRRASARPAPVRAPQPAPAPPATPAPTATPSPTDTPTAAPTDAPAPTGTPTTVPSPTTTPSPTDVPELPYCEVPVPVDWEPPLGWEPPKGWVPPVGWDPQEWTPPEGWEWPTPSPTDTVTAAPEPAGPTATPTSEPLPPNHTAGPDGTPEPLPTPTCALPPWAPQDEDAASITAQESDGVEAEETTEPTDVPTPTSTTAPAPTPDATR